MNSAEGVHFEAVSSWQTRWGGRGQSSSTEGAPTWVATAESAAAATGAGPATKVAVETLRAGGNAVDAAVAAAWALSVCEPSGSGLGGQTTLLIYFPDGKTVVLDGHSRAPAAVSRRTVDRAQQRRGHRATTIPSTPATLGAATRRYGRFSSSAVLQPAIHLAEEGFPVTKLLRQHAKWCRDSLMACPYASQVFLADGRLPKRGSILRQPNLARTLRQLAARGTDDFYRGQLAQDIAKDMTRSGGLLTAADLATCHLPVDREALSTSYHGHRVISIPPPGGGLQVLLGLKVFEALRRRTRDDSLPGGWYAAVAMAIDAVFRERDGWPLHPNALTPSLRSWLLGDERAAEIAAALQGSHRSPGKGAEEPGETTHLCTVDEEGMIVALTQSVQSLFGAKVANPDLGFFYNNYLCTCPRYRHPSLLGSRAIPQSNAAPTLLLAECGGQEHPVLALGAAGSRRITSSILQVIANCTDRGLPLPEAVDAPRIHPLPSGKVLVERRIAKADVIQRLSQRFGQVLVKAGRSHMMGAVQAIGWDSAGHWVGVADPRREGTADGY